MAKRRATNRATNRAMAGYRRFIGIFIGSIAVSAVVVLVMLYRYDPLRLFHRDASEPVRVITDLRQQAMSFIRYSDYESVILGTSMFENTSANQAAALFNEHFVNLSLSGSTYYVRSFPLRKILQNRPIKTVIYSVDFLWLATYGDLAVDYLYDDNRLNDFKVYLNKKYLQCLLAWSDSDDCRGVHTTLDMPRNWMQYPFYMARFGGAENWQKHRHHDQIVQALKHWQQAIEQIEQGNPTQLTAKTEKKLIKKITAQLNDGLVRYVAAYPETQFIAVFPPYFIETYAQWQQSYPARMRRYLYTIRYLVQQSAKYPNLQVYAFANEPYTDNIANYKDELHYHPDINRSMLVDIAAGNHRLTRENVEVFIKKLSERAGAFDMHAAFAPFRENAPIKSQLP